MDYTPIIPQLSKPIIWLIMGALTFLLICYSYTGQTRLRDASDCRPPTYLTYQFQKTDFSKCTIALSHIISGGPGKDGIPSIDQPEFASVDQVNMEDQEPIISLAHNGIAKAYPLSILIWHEIVNDEIAGKPISVTYCPLCNTSIVFSRLYQGRLLDFGTTGSLRFSDLVMYDRQTESFWQQYDGAAIAGELAGAQLEILPSRLEDFGAFKQRHPTGLVLAIPTNFIRQYGTNPYRGYDSSLFPIFNIGDLPDGIKPLERVVVFEDTAIALPYLQKKKQIRHGEYHISWRAGQASALDTRQISQGRDVGTVSVQRQEDHGQLFDAPYKVTFAFVWHAFNPDLPILGLMP